MKDREFNATLQGFTPDQRAAVICDLLAPSVLLAAPTLYLPDLMAAGVGRGIIDAEDAHHILDEIAVANPEAGTGMVRITREAASDMLKAASERFKARNAGTAN